jgi:hypothetical protein
VSDAPWLPSLRKGGRMTGVRAWQRCDPKAGASTRARSSEDTRQAIRNEALRRCSSRGDLPKLEKQLAGKPRV